MYIKPRGKKIIGIALQAIKMAIIHVYFNWCLIFFYKLFCFWRKQGGRGAIYYNITIVCTCTIVCTYNRCMTYSINMYYYT